MPSRARDLHRQGLAAGAAGHPEVGARHLRAGLAELGWTKDLGRTGARPARRTDDALAARLLISLAHLEAEQGRTPYGLRLLDQATGLVDPADRVILLSQRGLLLMRTGRGQDALAMLDAAVPLLAGYHDPAVLARVLLNRGVLHLTSGQVRQARADLRWCEQLAQTHGLGLIAAKARHNQGSCDLLAGDIPGALHLFDAAGKVYRASAPGNMPVVAMDKARALLAAGLASEAANELDTAIVLFREQRLDQDCAEAELARALAALVADDPAAVRTWAARAGRRFRRRGNETWAALAELTRMRAGTAEPGFAAQAGKAAELAVRLRRLGLSHDGALAGLLCARSLIAAGRPGDAEQQIRAASRGAPIAALDIRLQRRLLLAEVARGRGHPAVALGQLRAGLALIQQHRNRLGSLDLQTGAAALSTELAAAGLKIALDYRTPAVVFGWLERSRAQAFRTRPLRPPPDPAAAAILAELRQVSHLIRTAELNGQHDPAAVARRADLQRGIREHSWQAEADRSGQTTAPASLGQVRAALAESGQSLVSLLVRDGNLLALVIRGGSARLEDLGDYRTATEAARRLLADLDVLAGRRLPPRLAAVVAESVLRQTRLLNAELLAPLGRLIGDEGVVLIPTGALASIPWNLLPELRGRPLTICPSASFWLAAWRSRPAGRRPPVISAPLLVAGPHLTHAAAEISQIATVYPACRQLSGSQATVEATLRALNGAQLAHLATHGHHDHENFLFSRLDLADGPLMAYDIQRLALAPRQVILSACDVGRAVVRPGDEILGFTAALLYAGTATVVSSVTRVPDEVAASVMTAYHRAIATGTRPAEALATASLAEPFSSFICFGSG